MKNIHILPAKEDSPSRLHINAIGNLGLNPGFTPIKNPLVLYITSYENVKKGVRQWYLDKFLHKPMNSNGAEYQSKLQVIILTTDPTLIADGVQSIDDNFLQWFVKNSSCEFVPIITTIVSNSPTYKTNIGFESWRKEEIIPVQALSEPDGTGILSAMDVVEPFKEERIIIPQEEPKQYPIGGYAPGFYSCKCVNCKIEFTGDKRAVQCKPCAIKMTQEEPKPGIEGESFNVPLNKNWFPKQETSEEIAKKYYPPYTDGIITDEIRALREGFVKGYEVKAERMYSDFIQFGTWLLSHITSRGEGVYVDDKGNLLTVEDLFEQFKKK